jgi:DNA-binding NarL/FixJ family response regulator
VATVPVVLATMPALLGDIVRETLAAYPDVEVVAEVEARDGIASAVRRTGARVVVVGISPVGRLGLSGLLRDLLAEHPRLTVIALASDGRDGYVYRLRPHEVPIADLSPAALVQAIRATPAMGVHPAFHPFSAD